jgi:CheY-like chemotaxis protein
MKRHLRIAVADDEPDMRDYFRMILPRLGHEVVCVAGNGRDLVEGCRRTRPDLVITDVRMPELDGIDAAAAILAERPVPVILVTAYHDNDLAARTAGQVAAYLVKPIKQADLPPTIAQVMTRFEHGRAPAAERGATIS